MATTVDLLSLATTICTEARACGLLPTDAVLTLVPASRSQGLPWRLGCETRSVPARSSARSVLRLGAGLGLSKAEAYHELEAVRDSVHAYELGLADARV